MKFILGFIIGLILSALVSTPVHGHDYWGEMDRAVDADTFAGTMYIGLDIAMVDQRFRLYCVNAPESRGARKTEEGVELAQKVKDLEIEYVWIELVKKDAFGRWLVWLTPFGWDETLNAWLVREGVPFYSRLTRKERAVCEERLPSPP